MSKMIKKLSVLLVLVGILVTTACGFSVGNTSNEDYKSLFPDAAARLEGKYKTSQLGYKYSLDGYGELMVYVDTTNGHKFVLDDASAGTGGFTVQNESGEIVLHVYAATQDVYKQATAMTDEVKTVNGRQYFYHNDPTVEPIHLMSYMADCGLDAGFVLEAYGDEAPFELVAFRGTPIEGSSSDIYAYKGENVVEEPVVDEPAEVEEIDTSIVDEPAEKVDLSTLTTSTLPDDTKAAMAALNTDYNNILWGVQYPVADDLPGFVISVTPYKDGTQNMLLVAFTSLYDKEMTFSGSASALNANGEVIGDTFVYVNGLCKGNTTLSIINCGDQVPSGVVRWEECQLSEDTYTKYVAWEADYAASGNPADRELIVDYTLKSQDNESIKQGDVYVVLTDASGFVVAVGHDYIFDEIPAGQTYSGQISFYDEPEVLSSVKGLSMFGLTTSDAE